LLAFALALGIGVSFAWTPTVPDTILLPDSLGPLRPPYHLALGSSTDNIYVASESSDIIVVDGNTFQRIKRINTGTPVGSALLVSQHNKLYCSYPQQGRIGVIDCATNNIVRTIQVDPHPKLLCYSSGSDKLYCGDTVFGTVSVISGASDSVLGVLHLGDSLTAMAYDPTFDKLFVALDDAVLAVSCQTDSVVTSISSLQKEGGLCVNARRHKLYVVPKQHSGRESLHVVFTATDSVVAAMPGRSFLPRLVCNEATDRLYAVIGEEDIYEYDCSGDTWLRACSIWDYPSMAIACDTAHDRLYSLSKWGGLVEIDCATFEIASVVGTEIYGSTLEWDPVRGRTMCASKGWGDVAAVLAFLVFEDGTTNAVGAVPLRGWTYVMCHNPVTSKLYYRWGSNVGGVGVINEETNRVNKRTFLTGAYGYYAMTHNRTGNKFYFASRKGVGVFDGARDSYVKDIDFGGSTDSRPFWCPDGNKVYSYDDWRGYIAVVDCGGDSVSHTIAIDDLLARFDYLDNGRMLCFLRESLALIDSWTDSITGYVPIGGVYAAEHTGDGEKLYAVRRYPGRLEVWSTDPFLLLRTIDWPYFGANTMFLAYSDSTRKLYWFVDDSVLAIDATSDTVTARMAASMDYLGGCFDHTGRYLFCSCWADSSVSIYDTQLDSLAAKYTHLSDPPLSVAANPERDCIYVGCQDVILVYPDVPPAVEETIDDEREVMHTGASVLREVLLFEPASGCRRTSTGELLDVSGRRVKELRPGENDVRAIPPGVYFVCNGEQGVDRKVIITR